MHVTNGDAVVQELAAAVKGPLGPNILKRLDTIAAMVPFRPYSEPFGLPFGRTYCGPGPA